MRIRNLDIGVEQITHWGIGDELHLPVDNAAPAYLPQQRPLDEIIHRPSLDERLPDLLQPVEIDPALLDPSVLAQTRENLRQFFSGAALNDLGDSGPSALFSAAASQLETDRKMDEEVRAALALLLRG